MGLRTSFYRFDASHLTPFVGPLTVNAHPPRLSDLPAIDSFPAFSDD